MKKIAIFLFYSLFLVLLGRQLSFLPTLSLPEEREENLPPSVIRDELRTLVEGFEGDYSVFYEDLTTGEAFGVDHNTILTAASLNKLVVVAYLYHLAGEREIDLGEKIVLQAADVQDYGTGKLRYEEPGGTYTLRQLAELSFQHSDNTAIHLLTIRLGEDAIQAYAYELGMDATSIAFSETSPRDIGLLLTKIYNNEITTEALTREMFDYLTDTEFENRLPRNLPEGVVVHHKIGDADNMVHDAGIIRSDNEAFVLVVMTQGIVDEEIAHGHIGEIAQFIYDRR